jgi:sigma-B regulation protein RsbU (phosphoserine phosphatase)
MSALPTESGVKQLPLFGVGAAALGRPAGGTPAATFDVHAISIPVLAFTGDFYATHRYEDRLWFALGDVAGHGISAAIVMAMIQEELEHRIRSCAITRCDPSATMGRLHEFLRPLVPQNRFATVVIGHLLDDGTLRIANAGHCPPLILHRDGTIASIASTGPVIGMLCEARWSTATTRLEPGETLVLYSDGLVEARAADGEEFGIGGLKNVLQRPPGAAAATLAAEILDAVERHTGGVRQDDLTLVVVRR